MIANEPGNSSVLMKKEFTLELPKKNEVIIKNESIGINFIDIYIRKGIYPWPAETNNKNLILGSEGAGTVEAIGPDVTKFKIGDRVAFLKTNGAYTSHRTIEQDFVVHLPDFISFDQAAAVMLKGLTVKYLLNDSYKIKGQENVLFHASAGGVGSIAGQWLKSLGIKTIGTAGTDEKCVIAKQQGYENVINYNKEDFQKVAMEITEGKGFDVIYDSVGQATMPGSFGCLKNHGTLISFGQSSGTYTDLKISDLQAGSFFLSRPILFHFTSIPEWLDEACSVLFNMIQSEKINIKFDNSYYLENLGTAHDEIENRKTSGSIILKV
ncbi:quinone oxidoreductase [Alphaproteobacteria bacterium]|nr:quinone oxidoreductase [Alphaproteobacteria bacterium]